MISTFSKELDSLNQEELDNSFKCIGLAYLGLDHESMTAREIYEAPMLYSIASKQYFKRDLAINCPSI